MELVPVSGERSARAGGVTDRELVASLRAAIERYFRAVDQWEAAYQRYYRLPGSVAQVSSDMAAEQSEYDNSRRGLEELLPSARRLCIKYQLRDSLSGLTRISLGRFAPQEVRGSAIGRSERSAATQCLVELNDACYEWAPPRERGAAAPEPDDEPRSWWRRILNYFY